MKKDKNERKNDENGKKRKKNTQWPRQLSFFIVQTRVITLYRFQIQSKQLFNNNHIVWKMPAQKCFVPGS